MLVACCRIEVIVNTTSMRCDFLTDEIALADQKAVVFKIPKDVRRSQGSQYNTIVAGLFNGRSRMLGAAPKMRVAPGSLYQSKYLPFQLCKHSDVQSCNVWLQQGPHAAETRAEILGR